MTIENISFKEGIPFEGSVDDQLPRLLKENRGRRRVLAEGEYDLTPEVWTRHNSNVSTYNLIVRADGTGQYRMIPKYKDVETRTLVGGNLSAPRAGGRIMEIPQDAPMTAIVGPKRGDPTFRIYELVMYTPGPSPKKQEAPLSSTRETITESSEVITSPIRNIDEAERLIFNDAKVRIEALNWKQFGQLKAEPGEV